MDVFGQELSSWQREAVVQNMELWEDEIRHPAEFNASSEKKCDTITCIFYNESFLHALLRVRGHRMDMKLIASRVWLHFDGFV